MSECEVKVNDSNSQIIKLRGLPWNVSAQDIIDFLKDCDILNGEKGIHLITSPRDGRPNGEAFVELCTESDFKLAFDYNKKVMGHRYIEIFTAKLEEFEYVMKKQNVVQQDTFIKLRGLPYSCSYGEIEKFFEGLELKNGRDGIHIVLDSRGNTTGEAYVQFVSAEDTEKALKKNRDKIGHRYIEIFRSTAPEVRRAMLFYRPSSFDRNNRNSGGGSTGGGGGGGAGGPRSTTGRNSGRNFRDRPYDSPWAGGDVPWRNRNINNNNISSNNNNNNNNFNDFGRNDNFIGRNQFVNDTAFGNFGNNFENNCSNDFNHLNIGNNNFLSDSFNERNGFDNFSNGCNSLRNNAYDRFFNDNNGGCNSNNSNDGGIFWNSSNDLFSIHMRGLPYDCGEKSIVDFFQPIRPVNCEVQYVRGRHSGEAIAYFQTFADVQQAMKRHKDKMGNRYIELFFNKSPGRGTSENGYGTNTRRNVSFNGGGGKRF